MGKAYSVFVAGLRYAGRSAWCAAHLHEGDPLVLAREAKNPADKYAVAIYASGIKIGYVPQRQRWVSRAIDDGSTVAAKVAKVDPAGVVMSITAIDAGDVGASFGVEAETDDGFDEAANQGQTKARAKAARA